MLSPTEQAVDAIVGALTAPGAQFELTEATIRGATYPVFKNAPPNLRAYFALLTPMQGDKEFIVYRDERYTYAQIYAQAIRIAAALQSRYGLGKGDRVAIAMRNYPEFCTAMVAVLHLGCVAVPLNAWWTSEELDYGLRDCGARLVIADEERGRRISAIEGLSVPMVAVRTGHLMAEQKGWDRLEDVLEGAPATPWYLPPIDPDDDACIMYTSGSTGFPKGAVQTHRGIISALFNYLTFGLAMLQIQLKESGAPAGTPMPQQIALLCVPLFHVTGSHPLFLLSFAIGRKLIMMHKWDAEDALALIEKEKVTYFVGVPTMSLELMQHPERTKYDTSSLLDIAAGGAPRPPEHVTRLKETFTQAWPGLGYGLTETNAIGAMNWRESYVNKPGSTGRPTRPLADIRIFDDAMTELPVGSVGEVCIRSAANVRGYWNKPEETAKAFTADGWFKTGDLGRFDEDGALFIVDRKKDIIIRGGENISCQEVEAAIYTHPAVAEACVFGLPDDRLGEIVGAVVYLKADEQVEPDALIEFVKRDLAGFKVPAKLWVSHQPLPRLGSAKIDKVSLRKAYRDHHLATAA